MSRADTFRIADKLFQISPRADKFAELLRELGENGELWEVDEIMSRLGGH
jgi:hypothetical protein